MLFGIPAGNSLGLGGNFGKRQGRNLAKSLAESRTDLSFCKVAYIMHSLDVLCINVYAQFMHSLRIIFLHGSDRIKQHHFDSPMIISAERLTTSWRVTLIGRRWVTIDWSRTLSTCASLISLPRLIYLQTFLLRCSRREYYGGKVFPPIWIPSYLYYAIKCSFRRNETINTFSPITTNKFMVSQSIVYNLITNHSCSSSISLNSVLILHLSPLWIRVYWRQKMSQGIKKARCVI